ncbi:MAG TPA: D-inositol-3-phosphate glycosyltransferase [Actinomycetota bacterium]
MTQRLPVTADPSADARADAHAGVGRVALLSVHTCPLDQPGTGDSGGMNVYVRSVARRLAEMGVQVDVFTRWAGNAERIREVDPRVRVIHLDAGPARPVPKDDLQDHLCAFLYSLMRFATDEAERAGVDGPLYDAIHAHYWLSGWVGRLAAERWDRPLVQSFHTLGRVKNLLRAPGEPAEPLVRTTAEEKIIAAADIVLAPTPVEAAELVRLYDADPSRVRVVPPGVDTDRFTPRAAEGEPAATRAMLGVDEARPLVLFAGRLQPLKAPDRAIRALAQLRTLAPGIDPALVIVGGPSGSAGAGPGELRALARKLGVGGDVVLHPPVPHERMPAVYRAADVVLVPSRTESFGLVAIEASACGTPVVATDVGGLRLAVRDGVTGVLVPGEDDLAYARALAGLLTDPALAQAMGEQGSRYARRFDWRAAAAGLLGVYEEVRPAPLRAPR